MHTFKNNVFALQSKKKQQKTKNKHQPTKQKKPIQLIYGLASSHSPLDWRTCE